MKKNSFLILLLALICTGLVACYGADDSSQSSSQNSTTATDCTTATDSSDTATDSETPSISGTDEEKEIYYTVTFDTDGAGEVQPMRVLAGERISQPQTPSKTTPECEYTFLGWFYGEEEWNFEDDVVTGDITLVAHWQEGDKYSNPFLPKD